MRMCMDMVTDTMAPLAKLMFTTDEEEKVSLNINHLNLAWVDSWGLEGPTNPPIPDSLPRLTQTNNDSINFIC